MASRTEKSYGKHAATRTVPFSLEIQVDEFLARFAPVYEDCLKELRRDDAVMGHFHPPYPGATDYPSIKQLFRLPASTRMAFLDTYLILDMLRLFLKEDLGREAVKWLVERCDSVDRLDHAIVIQGMMQTMPR